MAILWTVDITKVDVSKKRADVSVTRLDDVTGETESYRYAKVVLETTAQRLDLLDTVWGQHMQEVDKQTAIDAFITNLEQLGKSNLEAREI